MMAKIYKQAKIVIISAVLAPALFAQINNFEFVQYDTTYTGSDDVVYMYGDIVSLTNHNQLITVNKVEHQAPDGWNASICVNGGCYPSVYDAVSFDVSPLDTVEFSLDAFPYGVVGAGSWTIFVVDSSTMEIDSVQINMEVVTVSTDNPYEKPATFELSHIYPNPSNAWVNFDLILENSGDFSVVLYALDGREILSRDYSFQAGKNQLRWGLEDLPSGNYIVSATGSGQTVSRQLSVLK